MTQRIVLFNGPPRCGKDTAAKHLFLTDKSQKWCFDRMSMPIKRAFSGVVSKNINAFGEVEYYEANKEEVMMAFAKSYRQWQIDFSEKFMKPLYGQSIFGKLFIERARRQSRDAVILVPDCGFDIEYATLAKHFGFENVLVVKIYRPGYGFAGDSRTYLAVGSDFYVADENQQVSHINNATTVEDFLIKVATVVSVWLRQRETNS